MSEAQRTGEPTDHQIPRWVSFVGRAGLGLGLIFVLLTILTGSPSTAMVAMALPVLCTIWAVMANWGAQIVAISFVVLVVLLPLELGLAWAVGWVAVEVWKGGRSMVGRPAEG